MSYTIPPAHRLSKVGRAGFDKMKSDRERRKAAVALFTGPLYGKPDTKEKRYLNLLRLGTRIMCTNLVPRNPKCDAMPTRLGLRPVASALARDVNEWIERSKFKILMREAVKESILSPFACIRTLIKGTGIMADVEGRQVPLGDTFMHLVDFDDVVVDPAARNRDEAAFYRVRYRVRKQEYLGLEFLDGAAKARIEALPALGEHESDDRTSDLSGEEQNQYDLFEMIELDDYILLCGDNTYIATIPAQEGHDREYVNVMPYVGAEQTPLEFLSYESVPGNFMPLAPETGLRDLSIAVDQIMGKMVRRLKAAKALHIYDRGEEDDALEMNRAADLDHIGVSNAKSHKTVNVSGVQQETYQGTSYLVDQWNTSSGNLMQVGGVNEDSETASQDIQKNNNAGAYITDMKGIVLDCESALLRRVAAYKLNDPLKTFYTTKKLATGIVIETELTLDRTQIRRAMGMPTHDPATGKELEDDIDVGAMGIHVSAASMLPMDPAMRMRRMNEFLSNAVPLLAIPGADPRALMKIGEENLDLPELQEVFPMLNAPGMMAGMAGGPMGAPMLPGPGMPVPGRPMLPPGPSSTRGGPGGGGGFKGQVRGQAQERAPR